MQLTEALGQGMHNEGKGPFSLLFMRQILLYLDIIFFAAK